MEVGRSSVNSNLAVEWEILVYIHGYQHTCIDAEVHGDVCVHVHT